MTEGAAPLIVGVCLTSDAGPAHSHPLTTITLPPAHLSHPLTELRPLITSALPPSLRDRPFVFLTHHGWEIPTTMETQATIEQVFQSHTHSISLCLSHPRSRIGLVAEGNPPVPLGFLFCDVGLSLAQLHGEMERQLPTLHPALVATGYSLLDGNGWPITREQETVFTVAEVVTNRTLRLKLSNNQLSESLAVVKATPAALPSTHSPLPILPDPAHSLHRDSTHSLQDHAHNLHPVIEEAADIVEVSLLEHSMSSDAYSSPGTVPYEILLSYVHREASDEAIVLRESLQAAGYRVFLDVECIRGGADWQDVLNDAVSNCTVFVPLITALYGQTLWTNREVKLADVLGKVIIPVNFLCRWPPQCLAIQFAATQFVSWPHSSTKEWNQDRVARVTKEIVERYQVETVETGALSEGVSGVIKVDGGEEEEEEEEEEKWMMNTEYRQQSFTRTDTQIIEEEEEGMEEERGVSLVVPQLTRTQRRSTIKSYASTLPHSLPLQYRKSIQESRSGKPLVVISCHIAQQEFARDVARDMEGCGYETWCSCDILHLPVEDASPIFQLRANEAGVVIFVFSKEFTESSFCETQVYYCEQRKRIIPVVYEPIQLPHWVSMLIGTSPFVSCQSSNYRQSLLERVGEALNPAKREVSLRAMLKEKAEVARLCAEVTTKLPKGRSLVYISGGTRFYSETGEQICRKLGRHLAQDSNIALVTGGFFGVGETVGRSFHEERERRGQMSGVWHLVAERDDQDKSNQTRQNEDGSFPPVPYGDTLFAGASVRQREMVTPHVVKICVLIEGGPGAAFEAQQFSWNGNYVIPVRVTGGAAGGLFNVPQAIFQRPPAINESDWSVLGNNEATSSQVAAAVVRIIRTLNFDELRAGHRTKRAEFRRGSDTFPSHLPTGPAPFPIQQPITKKTRTYSDSSPQPSTSDKL